MEGDEIQRRKEQIKRIVYIFYLHMKIYFSLREVKVRLIAVHQQGANELSVDEKLPLPQGKKEEQCRYLNPGVVALLEDVYYS
jgi:hypothetical protein